MANDRLRDAAHELAAMRESDAMAGALAKLIEDTEGMSDACAEAARGWSERLGPSQSLAYTGSAERAAAIIEGVKEDARLWALGYGAWEIIEPGIRRTYRNGRKGLERAETDPSDETLHEWRKRVKDMWYSLRLLQKMWPAGARSGRRRGTQRLRAARRPPRPGRAGARDRERTTRP